MGNLPAFIGAKWMRPLILVEIIGSFFTVIGKPVKDLESYKIVDQIDLLFQEFEKAPYFLILDNFEILLRNGK